MSKLARDGTAVPVSRCIIILGANAPDRGKYYFPYSADHVQDCSPYYPAQLINIYSFYICDLYIIYLYAYFLFATHVCMLVYCVNYYIYIIKGFLASTFCGGNLAKNPLEVLWQTVCRVCRGIYFLKHSSVKIIPKPLCSQKKQALEWGGLRFPSRVFDKIEPRWSGN